MAEWQAAQDLEEIARKLIAKFESVSHIELGEVLFLRELELKPPSKLAACYIFNDDPITYLTDKKYCIVVYDQNTDCMSPTQTAWLILHELKHIPALGKAAKPHNVEDFRSVLTAAGIGWADQGAEVPDLFAEEYNGIQ